jgi:hypothetical protein
MVTTTDLKTAVSDAISGSNQRVREAAVETLVAAEVEARTRALVAVLAKRDDADKKLQAVRAQPQFFTADGNPAGEPVFTAQQNGERKKLAEVVQRFDAAVAAAFADSPNWEPLKRLAAEKDGGAKPEGAAEKTATPPTAKE